MSLCTFFLVMAGHGTGLAQQDQGCEFREHPPSATDSSERVKPGSTTPTPLPVPDEPVGGAELGKCGIVIPNGAPNPPADVTTESWVVADLDTGDVFAAKDPHARQRPASLIKTLLSIVVTRDLTMDTVVTGTQADANEEGTKVGIGPGGQYTVRQLLQALLMRSGNDAAHALAGQLGGIPATLEKMNGVAKELGALDTRVSSPSGLDAPGMCTSAYDLALFFREALKQPEVAKAVLTKSIDFPGYGEHPGYKLVANNRLLGSYPGFIGGKTGYTGDARHTYLGGAKHGDKRLAVVLIRGEQHPVLMADQAAHLLDYGFGLSSSAMSPVGKLVDPAPAATPGQPGTVATPGTGSQAAPAAKPTSTIAFWLAGFAVVAVALGGLLWWRARRGRAA